MNRFESFTINRTLKKVFDPSINALYPLPGTQLAGGVWEVPPALFLKTEKKCPDFAKISAVILENWAVCVHLWVNFSLKMQF